MDNWTAAYVSGGSTIPLLTGSFEAAMSAAYTQAKQLDPAVSPDWTLTTQGLYLTGLPTVQVVKET